MKKNIEKKMLAGVCAGLADHFEMDASIVRAIFLIGALMGFGLPVLLYIVLAIVMPKQ